MTDFLYFVFVQQSAWWAGGISLYMTWMMGNKKWWAPFLGLLGQLFWLLLAVFTAQHGLLITVVLYTIVHGRNAWKWYRERNALTRFVDATNHYQGLGIQIKAPDFTATGNTFKGG